MRVTDETLIPLRFKRVEARFSGAVWEQILAALPDDAKPLLLAGVHGTAPMNDAIKLSVAGKEEVPGACVTRGHHIRVA